MRLSPDPLIVAALGGRPRHLGENCLYCDGDPSAPRWERSTNCMSLQELADAIGTSQRQVERWLAGQKITTFHGDGLQIDDYATSVGSHIDILWPEL